MPINWNSWSPQGFSMLWYIRDNQFSSVHSSDSFRPFISRAIQSAFGSMTLYFLHSTCCHHSEARNWKELYCILNSLENMAVDPVNSSQPYPQRNTLSTPRQAKPAKIWEVDSLLTDTSLKRTHLQAEIFAIEVENRTELTRAYCEGRH